MYISKKILSEFIPEISQIPNEKISSELTLRVAEVEGYKELGGNLSNIIVGEIKEVKKHENADKLNVCQVDLGNGGGGVKQIVCGAPNVEVGKKVAVCLPGGSVNDSVTGKKFDIKAAKIRGESSHGMICSERELGLSEEHEGILLLDNNYEIGAEFDDLLRDTIFEIENKSITHRGDCFSHLGIARELSIIFELSFITNESEPNPIITDALPLEIEVQSELISQFNAITLKGLQISESPFWLKLNLLKVGINPINNVVDLTNYLMVLLGQPLHAYDYDKVKDNKIIAREARGGEKLTAINHQEYVMNEGEIVITDNQSILGIAGIMGGLNSEVSDETQNIILESAVFEKNSILRTSRRLKLNSEATLRFSKGLDSVNSVEVLKRTVNSILDLAGGDVGSELLSVENDKSESEEITMDLVNLKRKVGVNIDLKTTIKILEKLGLTIKNKNEIRTDKENLLNVPIELKIIAPSWRPDLKISEDIIEEVIRIYGYDQIEPRLPERDSSTTKPPKIKTIFDKAREASQNLGFEEQLNYSFISAEMQELQEINPTELATITNAISPELKYVRPNIITSLYKNYLKNYKDFSNINFFEIGRVVLANNKRDSKNTPKQPWTLAFLSEVQTEGYDQNLLEFIDFKGRIELLLSEIGFNRNSISYRQVKKDDTKSYGKLFHPYRANVISIGSTDIGIIGEINPEVTQIDKVDSRINLAEIRLETLIKLLADDKNLKGYSQVINLPSIDRDHTVTVKQSQNLSKLIENLKEFHPSPNIKFEFDIIDVYKKESDINLTFRFTFIPTDETLTDETVNDLLSLLLDKI